jgi:hypothetical protein
VVPRGNQDLQQLLRSVKFAKGISNPLATLCDDTSQEDFIHLFFSCDFSQRFWWKLNMEWKWNTDLPIMEILHMARNDYNFICFKETLIVGCWSLWNIRNIKVFEDQNPTIHETMRFFRENFELVRHRAKPSLKEDMSQWLDTL